MTARASACPASKGEAVVVIFGLIVPARLAEAIAFPGEVAPPERHTLRAREDEGVVCWPGELVQMRLDVGKQEWRYRYDAPAGWRLRRPDDE